jgi:hypothetical protein
MGDMGGILDPLNIFGGGGGSNIGNVGRDFTGKPSPQSQEAALNASTESTKFLTDMSKNYYNQTAGLREGLVNRFTNFINNGMDPTTSAQYAPIKMTAERQYQTAMDDLMSKTPAGGALYEGMANLGGQKAGTITDMISKIIQDEYNKAYAMGQGSQSVAASGVQSGATASNQLLSSLAQQQGAGAQGTGNAVALVGSLLKYLAA